MNQVYILVTNGKQVVEGQVHARRESAEKVCNKLNKMSMKAEGRQPFSVLEMEVYK